MDKIPFPKKIPKKLLMHGDLRIDNYYWLRDDNRKNKEILNYLNHENEFTKNWFKKNKVNSKRFFKYYKDSLPKLEESIKTKIDN